MGWLEFTSFRELLFCVVYSTMQQPVNLYTILLCLVTHYAAQEELSVEVITLGNMLPDGLMGRLALTAPAVDLAVEEINRCLSGVLFIKQTYLYNNYSASCTDLLGSEIPLLSDYLYHPERKALNVTALIYPGCYDEKTQMAWMTKELSLLTIYGAVAAPMRMPHVIAAAYTNAGPYSRLIVSMLKMYKWLDIYVIHDSSPTRPQFYQYVAGIKQIEKMIKGMKVTLRPVLFHENVTFTEVLHDFRARARVMLYAASLDYMRKLLIEASKLNMTNGEYVYYTLDTGPDSDRLIYGRLEWQRNDSDDEIARNAFRSILIGAPVLSQGDTEVLHNYSVELRHRSRLYYNYTYGPLEQPNYVTKAMYSAYWMLAKVLRDAVHYNASFTDFNNGIALAKLIRGRTFDTPIGKSYIDTNGERTDEVGLFAFDIRTSSFKPLWKQDQQTSAVIQLNPVNWPNNLWPPPNTPLCGLSGLEGPCSAVLSSTVLVASIITGAAVVVGIIAVAAGIKILQRESGIRNRWWFLELSQFSAPQQNGNAFSALQSTFNVAGQSPTAAFTPKSGVAIYQKRKVYLTQIPSEIAVRDNRPVFLLFNKCREVRHPNINAVIGILSTITPSKCLTWHVDEFCERCDLETVITENSRTLLDLEFRHGMVADVLAGLQYVHTSPLRYHGYLRSSTCLVDSRFTVRLSKIGYDRLLSDGFSVNQWQPAEKTFVAPEHATKPSGSTAGDLYAVGLVIQTLFSDTFVDSKITPQKNQGKSRTELFLGTVQKCCENDPNNRPKLGQLIAHHRSAFRSSCTAIRRVMRRMERYAENLETCVAERTFQLLSEQKKCDNLLAEMLPTSIVAALRQGSIVEPEVFESVSILFSDIVGFAEMVVRTEPFQVVVFLNESHSLFDRVISYYDAYKVETINDSYLVSSGVPIRNGNLHALNLCKMAIKFVSAFKDRFHVNNLAARIGIHTGPCVAAVAGRKRPRYCLFGDTVNTASRMESHGEAGKVHISQPTADLVTCWNDESVLVSIRGVLHIKGKGDMQTYWVDGANQ